MRGSRAMKQRKARLMASRASVCGIISSYSHFGGGAGGERV